MYEEKIEDTKMFIPGFQFNPISAQLCSPYDDGLNLMWNAGMMKLQTNAMLNQFPSVNGSIFTPFTWQSNMNYLLDPRYTMMQFNQQYGNWGFGGVGSNKGGGFFGNFDLGSFWKNVFGGNNNSNGSNGSKSTDTVEQKQIKAIKRVIDKIKGTEIWKNDLSKAYDEALKKETDEEKLEALKEVIESIDKKELNKAIIADEEVSKLLEKSGYTKSKKDTDWAKTAETLANDLRTGRNDELARVAGMVKNDNAKIIPFISAWNDLGNGNLFKMIAAKASFKSSDKEIWQGAAEAFAKALTTEAAEYSNYSSVKTKTQALEKALETMSKDFTKTNIEAIASKFDALYAEIRVLKAQEADKYIQENYGFINDMQSGVIPDGAVLKATKEDLSKENISAPETVLKDDEDEDATPFVEQTAEEKVNDLVKDGKLVKCNNMTSKAKGVTLYRSKEKDSSGKYQYFIIRNDELVKVNGQVNPNGYIKGSNGKHISNLADADVSAFDESALPEKKGTTTTTTTTTKITPTTEPASPEDAYDLGYYVAQDLIGYTNEDEYNNVKDNLQKINKDNVLEFLRGYYTNDGGGNGLFLQLALESTRFKNSVVKKVAAALLEALEDESSIKSSEKYKTARRVLKRIAERKDADDFKMLNGDNRWGWNRIWGIDDLDELDDAIEEILKTLDSGSSETKE